MPVHMISVPDWLPATLNEFMRQHWAVRRKTLSVAANLIAAYARLAGVPQASGRRRVTLTFFCRGGRGRKSGDPDARLKVCLDALVRAGMLVDDDDRFCELAPRSRAYGPTRTVITLEDVP